MLNLPFEPKALCGVQAALREQVKTNMFKFIKKLFDRRKVVEYGDKFGKQFAQPGVNEKTGEIETRIKGEKYPLRAFPRHHVLHGSLMVRLKRGLKNLVIENLVNMLQPYKLPEEQWAEPIKELARVFDLMIEAEDEPSMKHLMKQFRDAGIIIGQEDDAWRMRVQIFLQKLNMKRIKLSESDKYYFRAKSFKVDWMLNQK